MRRRAVVLVVFALLTASCGEGTELPDAASTTTRGATVTVSTTTTTAPPAVSTTTTIPVVTTTTTTTSTSTTTTTAPPDTTPPVLTVTDPPSGATVTTRTYTFRGTTEPGCTVIAAGRYEADVAADGTWSIVLVLNLGGNVATISSTDPAGNTTTVKHPVTYVRPAPDYLRYGPDGLSRVVDGVAQRLADGAIDWAADDLMGGVLYTYETDAGPLGIHWLRTGAKKPVVFDGSPWFTGEYLGWPHVFYVGRTSDHLIAHDLVSGATRELIERPLGDKWLQITSVGGDRFVAALWEGVGPYSGAVGLAFWDSSGHVIDEPHNPYPTSCEPCELTAMLSPDGKLLAVRHRPDANWPGSPHESDDPAEWWRNSRHIDATVSVVELSTGRVIWARTVPAANELTDFDGRRVAISNLRIAEPTSRVFDIDLGRTVLESPGRVVVLRTPMTADVEEQMVWASVSLPKGVSGVDHGRLVDIVGDDGGYRMLLSGYADGRPTHEVWRSRDGRSWRLVATSQPRRDPWFDRFAVTPDHLVATAHDAAPQIWVSASGRRWNHHTFDNWHWAWSRTENIVAGPTGVLVHLVGGVTTAAEERVMWSRDLSAFRTVLADGNPPFTGSGALSVAGDPERYVAIRQHRIVQDGPVETWPIEHEALTSRNGRSWSVVSEDPFGAAGDDLWVEQLHIHSGKVYALAHRGEDELVLMRSGDLRAWEDVGPPGLGRSGVVINEFAEGDAGMLLTGSIGNRGVAWYSDDGTEWNNVTSDLFARRLLVAFSTSAVGGRTVLIATEPDDPQSGPEMWLGTPIGYD